MMHNKSRSPRSDSFFLIFTITIFGRHHKTLFTHQWLKCIFQIHNIYVYKGGVFTSKKVFNEIFIKGAQ